VDRARIRPVCSRRHPRVHRRNDGVARTFFLAPDLSGAEIQKKVNEVRTRAGIERTIGIAYPPAIVVRGTHEQVAAAGKLLR
jgi:hypothetical protein